MVSCQSIVKVVEKIYRQVFLCGILKTLFPFCIAGRTLASSLRSDHLLLFPRLSAVTFGVKSKCVLSCVVFTPKQCPDSLRNSPNGAEARTNIRIFAIPKLEGSPSYINLLAYRGHGQEWESTGRNRSHKPSCMFSVEFLSKKE